jgi:hypothetical protein
MSDSEYLGRLMTLERRVAELTGLVYRLEQAQRATAQEAVAEAPPAPVLREAAPPPWPPLWAPRRFFRNWSTSGC